MIEKVKLKNGNWENYPLQYWKNLSDYTGSASARVVSNRHTASWNVRKPKKENLKAFTSTAIKKEEIPADIKLFWNLLTRNFKMIICKHY